MVSPRIHNFSARPRDFLRSSAEAILTGPALHARRMHFGYPGYLGWPPFGLLSATDLLYSSMAALQIPAASARSSCR